MLITFTAPGDNRRITLNIQPASITISPRYGESYSFDRAGRLLSVFQDGRSYQRTLDHRLLERQKGSPSRRIALPDTTRDALLKHVFAEIDSLVDNLSAIALTPARKAAITEILGAIRRMEPEALQDDGEAYRRLFLPVSILPPDQYLALVLQATVGCSWNRCTFCGLYRDRQFAVRSVAEFRAHCLAVRDYFGAGLSIRRGIFLADANALTIPQARLVELIAVAQEVFGTPSAPRPLFSFISAFDARRKQRDDWRALRELGLQRVYIGLETGDDDLLRFVNKPGTAADAGQAVSDLKGAGISVGVIIMVGLGGGAFAEQHIANTVQTVSAMPLDRHDVIYLSAYRPAPGTEYPGQIAEAGILPLTPDEEKAQAAVMRRALRQRFPQTRVASYHVDGFAL